MIYRLNVKLFRLLHQFSRDCAATKPFDLDTVGLSYMNRAYELGKDAGRAQSRRHRSDTNYQAQSDDRGNGGESGSGP